MKVKLLNNGGFDALFNVKFPVVVEARLLTPRLVSVPESEFLRFPRYQGSCNKYYFRNGSYDGVKEWETVEDE